MDEVEKKIFAAYNMGWKDARFIVNREMRILQEENNFLKKKLAQEKKFIRNIKCLLS